MALHNNVFKNQIWKFFCEDVESCLEVSKDVQRHRGASRFKGGLNFTAALVIFSVIEFCAAFFHGKNEVTRTEIAEFMNIYFANYDDNFSDIDFCKKFHNIFRNGLSHQWSPKAGGIGMNFNKREIIFQAMSGKELIPILNIPPFFALTKKALKDFEIDLDRKPLLRKKFEDRYKKLIETDYKEMRIFRGLLKK